MTSPGQTTTRVYFPAQTTWYDFADPAHAIVQAPPRGGYIDVSTPINTIPAFQRSGSIIPLKMRLRRCSKLMENDPLTLQVALDKDGNAEGSIYLDDEDSFR